MRGRCVRSPSGPCASDRGAGLKSIIRDVLLNSMFEVPSRPHQALRITEQSIQDGVEPLLLTRSRVTWTPEGGERPADKTA